MSTHVRSRPPLAGILLVLLGLLFLADQFGWFEFGDVIRTYWPVIFILVGVNHLVEPSGRLRASGALFLVLGVLFLLANLGQFDWGWIWRLWPLALIWLGLSMMWRRRPVVSQSVSEDVVHLNAVLGGHDRIVKSNAFRGGSASAFMGGVDLDLREAQPVPEGAELQVNAMLGGVEIRVPSHWNVQLEGTPILGGFVDSRRHSAGGMAGGAPSGGTMGAGPVLRVKGSVFMGGVEVKE